MTKPLSMEEVAIRSAYESLSGYLEVLRAGDVIEQGYIDRLNEHYLPRLKKHIEQALQKGIA